MANLTQKAERIFHDLCILTTSSIQGDGYVRRPAYVGGALDELSELGLIDLSTPRKVRLTDSGRKYAIAQGWIAAPVVETPAHEPLIDTRGKTYNPPSARIEQGDIVETITGERAKVWAVNGDEINIEYEDGQMGVATRGALKRVASSIDAEIKRQQEAASEADEATPAPFAVGDYVFVVTDNDKIIRGRIEVLENVWYDVRTDLGALFIANVNATFRTFVEAKIYRSQRDGVSETPTSGETAMLTPDDIIALAIDDIRDQRRPANPARFADNVQSAIDSIRAENEALKQQLATARANLAVAQKALIAITSVKYDDMQAVRDRAETGLIESDYYVASLK